MTPLTINVLATCVAALFLAGVAYGRRTSRVAPPAAPPPGAAEHAVSRQVVATPQVPPHPVAHVAPEGALSLAPPAGALSVLGSAGPPPPPVVRRSLGMPTPQGGQRSSYAGSATIVPATRRVGSPLVLVTAPSRLDLDGLRETIEALNALDELAELEGVIRG